MNEPLVTHWCEVFSLSGDQEQILRRFSRYMDRHSFMIRTMEERQGVYRVCFTDEACRLWMTLEEMRDLWKEMKQGRPVPWNQLMERFERSDRT